MLPRMASGGEEEGRNRNPLLKLSGIQKRFGATVALSDGTFELRPGEIHALIGENGSGKSTLVKVVSGVHRPDSGTIELAGEEVSFRTPAAAQNRGIATVFQEVLVAESRSVLENIWLGSDTWARRTPMAEKQERAAALMKRLLARKVDLRQPVEELSLGDRQACCVARSLVRDPKVLILDESTAVLDIATRDRLFDVVRERAAAGVGVIIITHRMDELLAIGGNVTVLRSGATVATVKGGEWNPEGLVRLMTGAEALTAEATEYAKPLAERRGPALLKVDGLRLSPGAAPIDLEIEAGVLTGVAGLEGQGGAEFVEALRGGERADGQVLCDVNGEAVELRTPIDASEAGVVYVPRERRLDSLIPWMSIRENFALATLDQDRKGGWLSLGSSKRRFEPYTRALGIKYGRESDAITTLSGGNQQKVVIARWLAYGPRVLILNDPTRGVSISTKRELYKLLAALASEGVAIVMLSSEVDEHIELMDRVLVFREGAVSAVVEREDLSRESIVGAFFGDGAEVAA
jgi:ABC-type sugar transport system ATPase subunit